TPGRPCRGAGGRGAPAWGGRWRSPTTSPPNREATRMANDNPPRMGKGEWGRGKENPAPPTAPSPGAFSSSIPHSAFPLPHWRRLWRYGRALLAPVLVWVLVAVALVDPLRSWLRGEDSFDQAALLEWLEESRNHDKSLHDLIDTYLRRAREFAGLRARRGGR